MSPHLMICVAVMPPLKACLHESREITPTHRFGNLNTKYFHLREKYLHRTKKYYEITCTKFL